MHAGGRNRQPAQTPWRRIQTNRAVVADRESQAPRRKDGVTNETAKARRKDADGNKNDRRRRPESAC